jgi:hypothetical protein
MLSALARDDSLVYVQIKLCNLAHPDLVPAIARETHARGCVCAVTFHAGSPYRPHWRWVVMKCSTALSS